MRRFFFQIAILACSWDFGYSQVSAIPSESELLGTYKLDDKSRSLVNDHGLDPEKCSLSLKKDGLFLLQNAPPGISDDKSPTESLSKVGIWSVSSVDSSGFLIELQGLCVVPLSEKGERLAIPITIGDGDECNGIVFVKE
ncbi:hypothetical protein [Pedobacter sp. SYSU D00535]|uniref:hypothetical protein n=1 Tax=Pedobacter sp. SYSU D00535 TaxID=2810308 RepID=UPI001A96ED80|nr:hypothetical protein [Pedobacter sp. SYSU D00535]